MYCGKCGAPLKDNARFCGMCGSPFPPETSPAAPVAADAAVPVTAPAAAPATEPVAVPVEVPVVAAVSENTPTAQPVTPEPAAPTVASASAPVAVAPPVAAAPVAVPASDDVNEIIEQARVSQEQYRQLVRQFGEIMQQRRSGAITQDVFENAWRQLTSSHVDGEKAAKEGVRTRINEFDLLMRKGAITTDAYKLECEWLNENIPLGKYAVYEARMECLRERKLSGDISDSVFTMKSAELDQEYGEVKAAFVAQNSNPRDTGSAGWGVLGFLFPFVGLILYLAWHIDRPKSARMAGIGALIGVAVEILFYILVFGAASCSLAQLTHGVTRFH